MASVSFFTLLQCIFGELRKSHHAFSAVFALPSTMICFVGRQTFNVHGLCDTYIGERSGLITFRVSQHEGVLDLLRISNLSRHKKVREAFIEISSFTR